MSEEESTGLVEPTFDDGPAPADTPNETAPESVNTSAGADQATPAASEQETPSSSTNDQSTPPKSPALKDPFTEVVADKPVAAAPSPALPPELDAIAKDPARLQKLTNLEKLYGQQSGELGQLRKQVAQWEGLDRQQVESALQMQQRTARESQLNPWNRDHPQNRDFAQLRERRRIDDLRLSRVAPENREAVRQALEADYSPEELATLKSYESWRRREDSLSPEDREDRMRETARAEARAEMQNLLQYQRQVQATETFIAQHPDLLTKNRELLTRAMDERTPRSALAAEIAAKDAQIAELLARQSKDGRVVETAKAQAETAQRSAVIGRDGGQARRKGDPVKEALKRAAVEGAGFDAFDMLVQSREETHDPNE